MTKKLVGIAIIILILGIIGIGIRSIRANTSPTHPAASVHAAALNELGTAHPPSLLLADLHVLQEPAGVDQWLVSATQVNKTLQLTHRQDLLTLDAFNTGRRSPAVLSLNT